MRKFIACALCFVCILLLLVGCTAQPVDTPVADAPATEPPATKPTEPPVTEPPATEPPTEPPTVPASPLPEGTPLTEEEIAWFNEAFFSMEMQFVDDLAVRNIRNMFLFQEYESVKDIQLDLLLREGVGYIQYPSEAELNDFYAQLEIGSGGDVFRIDRKAAEEAFLENTGLTIDETAKNGMENLIYLKKYDAYYHGHNDTAYSLYKVSEGVRLDDGTVMLLYRENTRADPPIKGIVTLQPQGDSYWFVSNSHI